MLDTPVTLASIMFDSLQTWALVTALCLLLMVHMSKQKCAGETYQFN